MITEQPASPERVATALVNKGATLGGLGRLEEANGAYDELLNRLGDAPEPALRQAVARARLALSRAGGRD